MPATPESPAPAAVPVPSREGLRERLASRLPEILIESIFMVLAIVLAFALEEWREERELDRHAEEARGAIVQEVERNRDELNESRPGFAAALAALEAASGTPSFEVVPAANAEVDPDINLQLALLSSAAWRAAQSTEASRRIDYQWMLQVAQTYELQGLVQDAQSAAIDALVLHMAADDPQTRQATGRALLRRIRVLSTLARTLDDDYARLL